MNTPQEAAGQREPGGTDSDWGFSSGKPGMARETKVGLALIVVLLGAFGFVLYTKMDNQQEARADTSDSPTVVAGQTPTDPEGESPDGEFGEEQLPPQTEPPQTIVERDDDGWEDFHLAQTEPVADDEPDENPFFSAEAGADQSAHAESPFGTDAEASSPDSPAAVDAFSSNTSSESTGAHQDEAGDEFERWADAAANRPRDDEEFSTEAEESPFGSGQAPDEPSREDPQADASPQDGDDPFSGSSTGVEQFSDEHRNPTGFMGDERETVEAAGVDDAFEDQSEYGRRGDEREPEEGEPIEVEDEGAHSTFDFDVGADEAGDDHFTESTDSFDRNTFDDDFSAPPPQENYDRPQNDFGSSSETGFDGGDSFAPAAGEPQPEVYVVRRNDNYWNISRQQYGTVRYFTALARYNQQRIPDPKKMRPGMKVLIPPSDVLEARYPDLFPRPADRSGADGGTAAAVSGSPAGFHRDEAGRPLYGIGPDDTLTHIAHRHLGRASRWIQIYEMNREKLPSPNDLKVGTVLHLPADASRVQLVRPSSESR